MFEKLLGPNNTGLPRFTKVIVTIIIIIIIKNLMFTLNITTREDGTSLITAGDGVCVTTPLHGIRYMIRHPLRPLRTRP